ncbi:hypothetical protein [Natrinema salinisoli]|uniref:hypothetical protein n=1 Tax=Natrinema salinisoli TaxID=2878535 RepID=UPI001CF06E38|nr:hypothetical protein [Natrinema salinisoli]
MDRLRIFEVSVALLLLSTVMVILPTPPERIPNVEEPSLIGIAIRAGIWFLPPLLSGLVLYQIKENQFQFNSLLCGSVSVAILLLFLLNLSTVYQSENVVTYDERGMFLGAVLTLLAGCYLALFILVRSAMIKFG